MRVYIVTILLFFSSCAMLGQEKPSSLLASNSVLRGCTGSAYCSACKNCSGCAHCNSGGSCGVCSAPVTKKTVVSKKRKAKRKR